MGFPSQSADVDAASAQRLPVLHEFPGSSSSYRVRIALNLIGLDYESRLVDIDKGEHRSAEYAQVNPQGLVPVLDIDGHRLHQSLAIIEYLDETRHAGFLPDDPAGRARARAISLAIAADTQPVCGHRAAQAAASLSNGVIAPREWMLYFLEPSLLAVEQMVAHQPAGLFCLGSNVTLPDLVLVPQLHNARRLDLDLSSLPRLRAIESRLLQLPAVIRAHPEAASRAGSS